MGTETWAQILDNAISISHSANILRKSMNPIIFFIPTSYE